jgi:hypothetical protein
MKTAPSRTPVIRAAASTDPRGEENAEHLALRNAEALRVGRAELDPSVGSGGPQLGRAPVFVRVWKW